ncbi:shufflon system plasmid conjugative transfer pilus tip adhesin PilV [Pedobacter gandavensis]|uniref:shufflon system plasmid conjugative transfer pilus tip adhesin PilV n=1 Tax=Pedobacter gandavensis TaxID=2679963 RepID=UPI00292FFCDA|nr:shufflon system plasmid conjugative transfer pilus tip adhesin PilV [Pedobacter gandavensis]
MSENTFIDDQYIDQTIKSAGAYNPALNKTQGVKLRELIKRLRDRIEEGNPDATSSIKGRIKLSGDLSGTADAPTVPGKANVNGSNAKGTWPIDITGVAAEATNAINWGGRSARLNDLANIMFAPIVVDGSDGKGKLGVLSHFNSWLNINPGGETLSSLLTRGNQGEFTQSIKLQATDPSNGYYELKNFNNPSGSVFRMVAGVWGQGHDGFSIFNSNGTTPFFISGEGHVHMGFKVEMGYGLAVNGSGYYAGEIISDVSITGREFYSSNGFRSKGDSGWFNQDYSGGIYMKDTTWVRVSNGKGFLCESVIESPTIKASSKLFIPSTSGKQWSIYVQDN